MRQQNGGQAIKQLQRRNAQVKESHQCLVDPPLRTDQRVERRRHHHRREDKRQQADGTQGFAPREIELGKQPGSWQTHQQGQDCGEKSLVEGEAKWSAHLRPFKKLPALAETLRKHDPENGNQWLIKEKGKEYQRYQPEGERQQGGAFAHDSRLSSASN